MCAAFRKLKCPWVQLKTGRERSGIHVAITRKQRGRSSRPVFSVACTEVHRQTRKVSLNRIPYEKTMFRQHLSPELEADVAIMISEQQEREKNVSAFSESLPVLQSFLQGTKESSVTACSNRSRYSYFHVEPKRRSPVRQEILNARPSTVECTLKLRERKERDE